MHLNKFLLIISLLSFSNVNAMDPEKEQEFVLKRVSRLSTIEPHTNLVFKGSVTETVPENYLYQVYLNYYKSKGCSEKCYKSYEVTASIGRNTYEAIKSPIHLFKMTFSRLIVSDTLGTIVIWDIDRNYNDPYKEIEEHTKTGKNIENIDHLKRMIDGKYTVALEALVTALRPGAEMYFPPNIPSDDFKKTLGMMKVKEFSYKKI